MTAQATEELSWAETHRLRRAVVVVDIVESVRLMSENESLLIDQWRRFVHVTRSKTLPAFGGQMVKSLGDGLLLTFESARSALACIRAMRMSLDSMADANVHQGMAIQLRNGLHVAEVVVDELDIYGVAVNLAARLASLAGPGEIIASAEAVDELVAGLDADIEDLGDCYLKHIAQPVRGYRVSIQTCSPGAQFVRGSSGPEDSGRQPELPRPKVAVLTLDGSGTSVLPMMVADELATLLSVHATLDVVSRMSTRTLTGIEQREWQNRLGVNYLLDGSCSVVGATVFVALELVFARDQRVIWRQSLQVALEALVARPGDILSEPCSAIMAAIEVHETGRAKSLPLASLDSYALLIGGVRLMHRLSRYDFDRAHEVLEALTARHPRHPDGYAWLAKWHILQVHQGWSPDPARSSGLARDMARRALDHDDRCGVAMVVSGMVKTFNDRDLGAAEDLYQRALDANPNDALAWLLKGTLHAFRGEGDLAIRHARHASALSPLDPMRYYFDSLGASAEASAGNYEEAIRLARRSLRANVMHASTLRILTIAYAMLERMEEAREMAKRIDQLEPGFTVGRFLARSPSAAFPIGRAFADALSSAGVPR